MATIDIFNNGSVSVTTDSTEIRPAMIGNNRRGLMFLTNSGLADCFISFGGDAIAGKGVLMKANGGAIGLSESDGWNGSINGITSSGTTTITFAEGVDE